MKSKDLRWPGFLIAAWAGLWLAFGMFMEPGEAATLAALLTALMAFDEWRDRRLP